MAGGKDSHVSLIGTKKVRRHLIGLELPVAKFVQARAKGIGELDVSGVAPVIANAVYEATGVRARAYPITLDKLSVAT